eukprot:11165689-Lingulodinium_polyedra.AAC.1
MSDNWSAVYRSTPMFLRQDSSPDGARLWAEAAGKTQPGAKPHSAEMCRRRAVSYSRRPALCLSPNRTDPEQ